VELPEATRRVFLARSLQTLGLLAVGPACSPSPGLPAAPPDLRLFEPGQAQVLAAVAEAFVPPGGAFPAGASDVGLVARIDAFLAEADPELAEGLRGGLLLLEWAGPLAAGRFGRFSRLGAGDRAAVIAALPRRLDALRQLYAGLKQLCLFLFYATPGGWQAAGYDGPWVEAGQRDEGLPSVPAPAASPPSSASPSSDDAP